MIRIFSTFIFALISLNIGISANTIKVNGIVHNGGKYEVFSNVENRFLIELDNTGFGTTTLQGDDFTFMREDFRISSPSSPISSTQSNKMYFVITPKSSATINSKGRITVNQFPGNTKNESFLFNFDFVLVANPVINSIELVNSNIRSIRSGEIFKVKIKGSGLKNIFLKLPKSVSSKISENNGKEMIIDFKAEKGFNGIELNQSNFGIVQEKVKLNFKSKALLIKAS